MARAMAQILVVSRSDRFLGSSRAGGPARHGRWQILGAVLGSLLLHGLVSLGLVHRAPVVPNFSEVPIEIIVEAAVPAPAPVASRKTGVDLPEAGRMPPSDAGSRVSQQGSSRPASPARPRSLGFEQEPLRAVAVQKPLHSGEEPIRYDVAVLGQLEHAKHFPARAAKRRVRGTAIVGFALDASGRVLVASLLKSSGDADLDRESLAVVYRAAPFPEPPLGARRQFAVDISFGTGGRSSGG
jgi:TonB family protein